MFYDRTTSIYAREVIRITNTKITFDIPYIKLHFYAEMVSDTRMPATKTAALRGGLGEMLLRQNCVMDRNCESCRFNQVCVVRHTFYSSMEKKPVYVTGPESVGYLIECTDKRTEYKKGSSFEFSLILFGDSIAFFNIYLQAFYHLGMVGLGKYKSRFQICEVRNAKNQSIVSGNHIDMSRYQIHLLSEYIHFRKQELKQGSGPWQLKFVTPLSMKYQQEYMERFYSEALVKGAARRVQMLDYYIGTESEIPQFTEYPEVIAQNVKKEYVKRYSRTQDSHMTLQGIIGSVTFDRIQEPCLDYLIAGEVTHIGKNTSFGFGKYIIRRNK